MRRPPWISTLAVLVGSAAAISVLDVLKSQPQLSVFYGYVNGSTNGTNLLRSANNFTLLAPSNDAIIAFLAKNPTALTKDAIDATIQYSLLQGGYPSLSFTDTPQFAATNLQNATYSNVTGGQRVELILGSSGQPQAVSGNKSVSASPTTVCSSICSTVSPYSRRNLGTGLHWRVRPHNRPTPHNSPHNYCPNHCLRSPILSPNSQHRRLPRHLQSSLCKWRTITPRRHLFYTQLCRRAGQRHGSIRGQRNFR